MNSRNKVLSSFNWTNSTLYRDAKQAVEALLIEFHNIFAQHRLDFGIKTEFKVQSTPLDKRLACSQSLPTLNNPKDNILGELARLNKYGIITILPFIKKPVQYFHKANLMGKNAYWLASGSAIPDLSSAIPEADSRKMRLIVSHKKNKWRPSTWASIYGCQWTIIGTYCNSGIAIGSRRQNLLRKIHSHDKIYQPFDWSCIPTTQQNKTLHASTNLKVPLFFNAILKWRTEISYVIEPLLNPVETILHPGERTAIWIKSQIYTDNKAISTIQPSSPLKNDEDLLICTALSSTKKQKTYGPNQQFSGPSIYNQKDSCSKVLDINSRTICTQ